MSLHALAAAGLGLSSWTLAPSAMALPIKSLQFPRDFGSHPDLQTEWWYITGQLQA
ncbi:MAG: carotenoid 1,2-hydratase, partial [Comamonas sp.]